MHGIRAECTSSLSGVRHQLTTERNWIQRPILNDAWFVLRGRTVLNWKKEGYATCDQRKWHYDQWVNCQRGRSTHRLELLAGLKVVAIEVDIGKSGEVKPYSKANANRANLEQECGKLRPPAG